MNKKIIFLVFIFIIFIYLNIFLKNLTYELYKPKEEIEKNYVLKIKNESKRIMLEIIGDLEILFNQNLEIEKNEKDELEKKFNKLIKCYNNLLNINQKYELSQQIFYFFYQAELLECKLNKNLTYFEINEKYQYYISFFYDVLEN